MPSLMKEDRSTGTVILIVLIGLRLWGQFERVLPSPGALLMFCVYLAALVGIWKKKHWGAVVCGAVALLDIPMVLFFSTGANRIGAVIVDLVILYLSYGNYRSVAPKKEAPATDGTDVPEKVP